MEQFEEASSKYFAFLSRIHDSSFWPLKHMIQKGN